MSDPGFWMTQDGRRLDIRWMQSQHLAHSVNMVMRKSNIQFRSLTAMRKVKPNPFVIMLRELDDRKILSESVRAINQVHIYPLRETLLELCMLRAIIDTRRDPTPMLENFRAFPAEFIQSAISQQYDEALVVKFTEYRLLRAGA